MGQVIQTETVVVKHFIGMHIHWPLVKYVEEFLKGLNNEDQGDKNSKGFFSEPCYVTNQGTQVKCDHHHEYDKHPYPNPETEC